MSLMRKRISEVITMLQESLEQYGDVEVSSEGCDCYGNVVGVRYLPKEATFSNKESVLLCRDAGEYFDKDGMPLR